MEVPILTPSTNLDMPPDARLDAIVRTLAKQGRHRDVISFVEHWDVAGAPTRRARLAQIRSLLALCLTDRAWVRLRELEATETEPEVDSLKLLAEMFILRGWPQRAREPLDKVTALEPDDEELQGLARRAQRPPARPEPSQAETADFDKALRVAEAFVAQNSHLRARTVLERLRRDRPDHPRLNDLLWGLQAEFLLGELTMAQLAERFTPDLTALAEDFGERTESFDRTDHGIPTEIEEVSSAAPGAFPSLFRSVELEESGFEHDEKTESSPLAPLELGLDGDGDGDGTGVDLGGDTQILTVLHTEGQASLANPDRIHDDVDEFDGGGFDLDAFRREMGMAPPSSDLGGSDLSGSLEAEDDDLIVLTRQEPDEDEVVDERPLADLPLDPPTVDRPVTEELELDPSTSIGDPPDRTESGTSWWVAVLVAVVLLGTLAMLAMLALGLAAGSAG